MMEDILEEATMEMDEVIDKLRQGLSTVRTGRASALMLDGILVEYYGAETPLNQISSVSVQEGRSLVVKPFDPSSLKDIERAIEKSDLELPVQNDGNICRINVPALTEESRLKLCKKVVKYAEESKIVIRNARRDANDAVKKDDDLTEDMQKKAKEEIQKLTDKYVATIEEIAKDKEAAIMTI